MARYPLATIVIVLLFAGCGPKTDAPVQEPGPPPAEPEEGEGATEEEAAAPEEESAPSAEPVTIRAIVLSTRLRGSCRPTPPEWLPKSSVLPEAVLQARFTA